MKASDKRLQELKESIPEVTPSEAFGRVQDGAVLIDVREPRAAGLEVVGVWHSHPDHSAQPSETDRSAAWEGWSYLILSVTSEGVTESRSWRLREEAFIEEVIEP